MIEELSREGIEPVFINAYDKDFLTDELKSKFSGINLESISLFLKHFDAWIKISAERDVYGSILSEPDEYGLVLEDNIILVDDFKLKLNKYIREKPFELLMINEGLNLHIPANIIKEGQNLYYRGIYPTKWGGNGGTRSTDGYVISRNCARYFIQLFLRLGKESINKPIDLFMNDMMRFLNTGPVYWAEPSIVKQTSEIKLFKKSESTDIYSITVSTRYSDLLKIIIHNNAKFFKKWYIITHPEDSATINVVKEANLPNIELLFFDFYEGAKFNKGGAINYCQKYMVSQVGLGKTVLLLDSDIYLPDNFLDVINSINFRDNILYGQNKRYDFSKMSDFILKKGSTRNPYYSAHKYEGFFQLFIQTEEAYYKSSFDCSKCDLEFHKWFSNKIPLPLTVYHLGQSGINWKGRIGTDDFIIDV